MDLSFFSTVTLFFSANKHLLTILAKSELELLVSYMVPPTRAKFYQNVLVIVEYTIKIKGLLLQVVSTGIKFRHFRKEKFLIAREMPCKVC